MAIQQIPRLPTASGRIKLSFRLEMAHSDLIATYCALHPDTPEAYLSHWGDDIRL